jgi:MYXO-CTERM domain-containing protein
MANEPGTGPLIPLILAKAICCGALLLAATGALSGFGAWLFDGGLVWIALAGLALLVGLAFRRRRRQHDEACSRQTVGHGPEQKLGARHRDHSSPW